MNSAPLIHPLAAAIGFSMFILSAGAPSAQGPLAPPGPPAPSMKTLDQVEPRVPLTAGSPGVTTEAASTLVISQPGSYYLTGNLEVNQTNGIRVAAVGVSIDLMGYQISRVAGAGGNGIYVEATSDRCALNNGSIVGFAYGLQCAVTTKAARGGSCVDLSVSECSEFGMLAGEGWRLEGCRAHDNSGSGIYSATGSSILNCTATNNAGIFGIGISSGTISHCVAAFNTSTSGILALDGTTLLACSANSNSGAYGIQAGSGCTLTGCSAVANSSSMPLAVGILAGSSCSLTNCSARDNTSSGATSIGIYAAIDGSSLTNCTAGRNTNTNAVQGNNKGIGIRIDRKSVLTGCASNENSGDGFSILDDNMVVNCIAVGNGTGGDGAGIHARASRNRIDGNHLGGNDRGIVVAGTKNTIVRNTAVGNTVNFEFAADNRHGAIVNLTATGTGAVSGSAAASTLTTTDPWANLAQ